ncbi:MAG: putative baseplate hub protein [Prokaryotic dsDNA virus sp.]|nr:MAG: putative baseplate hub protein [Prokaryotic dsDNA virus sp.]
MANRNSTSAFQTEIVKAQNQPIHLIEVYFDAPTGTQYMTDAYIPITYNSNTYSAAGYFLSFSDIQETSNLVINSLTISLSGIDKTYINYVLDEDFIDRKVIIRKGFLSTTDDSLIADPVLIFQGNMDTPTIQEAEDAGRCTVSITAANLFVDFEKTPGRFSNTQSQNIYYPGDKGFDYCSRIIQDVVWGAEFDAGTRVSGAGSLANEVGSIIETRDIGYSASESLPVVGNNIEGKADGTMEFTDVANEYVEGEEVTFTNYSGHFGSIDGSTYTIATIDGNTYNVGNISYPEAITTDGGNELLINDNSAQPGVTSENGTNEITVPLNQASGIVEVGDQVQVINLSEDVGGIEKSRIDGLFHEVTATFPREFVLSIEKDLEYSAPPLETNTSVSDSIQVNQTDHGLSTGDSVVLAGASATGGVPASEINKTHSVGYVLDSNSFMIPVSTSPTSNVDYGGGSSVTIGGSATTPPPISTTSGSATVTIYQNNHGLAVDDKVTISGALDVGGIESSYFNKQHTVVSVPDSDSFTITVGKTATSTATGGGKLIIIRVPVKATSDATGGGKNIKIIRQEGGGSEKATPWKTSLK